MKQKDKSFIYVVLIFIIICASIGYFIIKSSESYNPVLYSEVYSELEDVEEYIENTREIAQNNVNSEEVKEDEFIEELNRYRKQGKIIAIISIDKLGIKYPILRDSTEENLRVAPTKFWGADPNEIGNFCIAGHNFRKRKIL